jgi:hypothetical protein
MLQSNQTPPLPKKNSLSDKVVEQVNAQLHVLEPPPPPVGWYILDEAKDGKWQTKYGMRRKPHWLARFMMKLIFDIRWSEK